MERRTFLKLTGVAGILASHRAPAFAQGTKVHIVRWVDFIPEADAAAKVNGRWLAVPHSTGGNAVAWRRSWHSEIGVSEFPKTMDAWREVGKKLKAKGRPVGQALGHSFGDPPTFCYAFLWSYGGAETDTSGKKVVLNSKGTLESVKFMQAFWKDACDEGGLAWDDTNNNRAFHAGE